MWEGSIYYLGEEQWSSWTDNLDLGKSEELGALESTSESPTVQFSSVQSHSRVWLFAAPRTAARQASLSITNSWSPLKLTSTESVMPSKHHNSHE